MARLPKAYAEAVRACCRGEKPWPLLLLGSIGSGKTCAALLTADWTVGPTVMHTEDSLQTTIGKAMDGLLLDERPGASFDLRLSVEDVWERWYKAELCVIDDLGQRRKTAGATDYIFRAIDSREHKPLIVTSNLTWDEIRRSDERLESRLEQTIVEAFDLPDQRCMR